MSSTAGAAERPLDQLLVDVVQAWRPGSPGRAARRAGRGRPARPARRWRRRSPCGCSPSIRSRPSHGRSGRADAGPRCRRAISSARPAWPIAWAIRPSSSARCSRRQGVHQPLRPRRRGGPGSRRAPRGSAGCSGKNSPYCSMNSSKSLLGVLAAGVGVEHVVQRGHHLADALQVLGRRVLHRLAACPANCASSTSPRSRSWICWYVWPRLGRAPLVLGQLAHGAGGVVRAARRARPRPSAPSRPGRGTARARSCLHRLVEQLARPARACRPAGRDSRSSRARCGPCGAATSRPSPAARAAAQQPVQRVPRRHARPARRRRSRPAPARMSNGGSSGSGPPRHAPYRDVELGPMRPSRRRRHGARVRTRAP